MIDTLANDIMDTPRAFDFKRRSYSGRGMMGERTTAIVGPWVDLIEALLDLNMEIDDFRWDAMGRDDFVIY